jgi:DNA polymerase-1
MLIFCDIETDGLKSTFDKSCKITRIGIAIDDEPALSYDYSDADDRLLITHLLEGGIEYDDTFVFHNAAFDVTTLRLNGFNIVNYHDTMCMSYVMNPAPMQNHSLGNLAQMAGGEKTHFDFSTTKSEDDEDYDEWASDLSEYNINDVEITRKVFDYLSSEMDKDESLWDYYFGIELPYIERIIEMLQNGVLMDLPTLQRMLSALTIDQTEMVKELEIAGGFIEGKEVVYSRKVLFATKPKLQFVGYNRRGDETTYDHCELAPFNPNSGSQIEKVLLKDGFTDFPVFTKAGAPSFNREALEQIPHPLARKIIALKDLQAVLKFVPPLMEVEYDGRLRTSFKQFNTVTGRLSSASPNLQNMPAQKKAGDVYSYRADDAYNIRKCFIAPEGYQLVVGDLNRIELVVLAFYLEWVLNFSAMADAVRAGEDLHQSNADLWGCERRVAKTVIFCLVYGGGANKIAHITGISVKEAKQVIARIYATTPIEELKAELISYARKNRGYFKDVLGRRLHVPAIVFDKKGQEYARAERQCFNYLIQGGAASIFKKLQNDAAVRYPEYKQLLTVHDETVYEVRSDSAQLACEHLTSVYTNDTLLSSGGIAVPITCSFHYGNNWYDAKEGV